MKIKVIQLVFFENPVETYALYEAIITSETNKVVWISEKPLQVIEKYHDAIEVWGKLENKYSGLLDIVEQKEYNELMNGQEYEENELDF